MITYSKDHLLLIKHSRTLITQRADEDVISILKQHSCPITQPKRRNRRRRGWMAGLRRVAPDKMTLPNVLACNARSIFNKSEDLNSLAISDDILKMRQHTKLQCWPATNYLFKKGTLRWSCQVVWKIRWVAATRQKFSRLKGNISPKSVKKKSVKSGNDRATWE